MLTSFGHVFRGVGSLFCVLGVKCLTNKTTTRLFPKPTKVPKKRASSNAGNSASYRTKLAVSSRAFCKCGAIDSCGIACHLKLVLDLS